MIFISQIFFKISATFLPVARCSDTEQILWRPVNGQE